MKNILLMIVLAASVQLYAQEQPEQNPQKHEIKVNGLYLVLGLPEVSYERILNEESSVGASLAFSVDSDIDLKFAVTPFYRFYFGKKRAAGLFLESNMIFFSAESDIDTSENLFGIGAGIGLGGKFLTNNGWTGELLVGAGRNFLNDNGLDDAYPRIGISIGKRF